MAALIHPKIVDQATLLAALAPLRDAGRSIVFTNGCFDILHPGHVDLLARAKALGDILILGLNTDESVRRLGKRGDRPFNPLAARAFVLAHLASVDYVTAFGEDTPQELIAAIQPDVLVKGGDWQEETIVGRDTVRARGGKVLSLPLIDGFSTTALAEKIAASCK